MDDPTYEHLVTSLRHAAVHLTKDRSIRDLEKMLNNLVAAAVETVPGVDGAGISRTEQGAVRSSHSTDGLVYELDELQSALGQGPCITAADDPPDDGIVVANDLGGADEARWPLFAPRCVQAGYRAIMSVTLSLQGRRRSALNLYGRDAGVFDDAARCTGGLFGVQAAALLHGADHAADLAHALETRDVIGQAKGILMERFTTHGDAAFQMLVSSSQDTNMKLVDVATWLVGEADSRRHEGGPSLPT